MSIIEKEADMDINLFRSIPYYKLLKKEKYRMISGHYDRKVLFNEHDNRINLISVYHKNCIVYYHIRDVRFYEFISIKYKIQQDMEMRAVNKILQQIIGDDMFIY